MIFKALIVDDSRTMRQMVMNALQRADLADGFEFNEAENGAEAVGKVNAANTDIIFMDWNMPKMNGFEAAQKIHDRPRTRHIPIVMVTSEKGMDKLHQAMTGAGTTAYICKPFTPGELQNKLRKLFQALEARKQRTASTASSRKESGFFSKLVN